MVNRLLGQMILQRARGYQGEESAKRVGEAIAGVFSKGDLENQL